MSPAHSGARSATAVMRTVRGLADVPADRRARHHRRPAHGGAVGTDGTIDWYCCPRFDSPSVFAAILDKTARRPLPHRARDRRWTPKQLYLPDTNVLITRFLTADGRRRGPGLHADLERSGSPSAQADPARSSACAGRCGSARGRAALRLRARRARDRLPREAAPSSSRRACPSRSIRRSAARVHRNGVSQASSRCGRARAPHSCSSRCPRRTSRARTREDENARGVRAHRRVLAALALAVPLPGPVAGDGAPVGADPQAADVPADGRDRRGADDQPAGAARRRAELGLPLHLDPRRRVLPLRAAAARLHRGGAGVHGLADGAVPRAAAREQGPLQIMYGIDGRADLEEEVLDHLEGYRGSAPGPDRQRRGRPAPARHLRRADRLRLPLQQARLPDPLRRLGRPRRIVDWVCENWDQADEGIWEVRGGRQHFTYSRLMSWVALERAIRIADARALPADRGRWQSARDQIYRPDHDQGVERGAAGVRPALRIGRPRRERAADAARQVHRADRPALALDARRDVARARLRQPRLPLQRRGRRPTGSSGDEGTFSICTFWYVEALARAGRLDEARLAFEKMLTYANHLGLYGEEIGLTGEALGNFPQAFTHLALISAGHFLDRQLG